MKKINELINNNIVILGNDLNSFLTSYSLKTRFPKKEINHLIIKNCKSDILSDNVYLSKDWIKNFDFKHNFNFSEEMIVKNFYEINNTQYKNNLKCLKIDRKDFLQFIKNKCIEIGVNVDEGYIKDIFQIKNSTDSSYKDRFNDFVYTYIQFDNLKVTKNIHAGFYIDCLGEKSFFFDDDYFDKTSHTANITPYSFKYKNYSKLLPNNYMISGCFDEKSDNKKSICEAIEDGILYKSYDGNKCYIRYYFNENFNTKQVSADIIRKKFNIKDVKLHKNINSIREKNTYLNVFAMGNTIGNLENVVCNSELITQKLLIHFVELFKHKHISVFSKKQWSEFVNSTYEEYANLTSLHYALTTRSDTEYWQDILNQNYKIKFDKLKNFDLKPMMEYFNR